MFGISRTVTKRDDEPHLVIEFEIGELEPAPMTTTSVWGLYGYTLIRDLKKPA